MARRQRGEGAVYQRASDGRWMGTVELGYVNGKRKRKVISATTQQGAIRKRREAQKAADAGNTNTASMTVATWLEHWLADVCPSRNLKPKTVRTYRTYIETYLIPAIGKVKLDKLNRQHLRTLHRMITDQGLSTTTARNAHRILSTALADAEEEGKVVRNVAQKTKAPPQAPAHQRPLSLVEARAMFAQVEGDRLASRWQFALTMGHRQGECLGLMWDHVDLKTGVVDLEWQLQRIPYRHGCSRKPPPDGELWPCGHARAFTCPERALDVTSGLEYRQLDGNLCLQRLKTKASQRMAAMHPLLTVSLIKRHDAYLMERDAYERDLGLVWCRLDGRPIDGRDDYMEWQTHLASARLPALPLHSARHTSASVALLLGVPEAVRMSMMGHSEVATTRGYAHVDMTLQRNAQGLIGDALFTHGSPAGPEVDRDGPAALEQRQLEDD